MQVDKQSLIKSVNEINKAMSSLNGTLLSNKWTIENRLDDLVKTKKLLKITVDALSNDPNDPYLESPLLDEFEEKIDSVSSEIENLEDILEILNAFDLSPLIIYSDDVIETNDDIIESTITD